MAIAPPPSNEIVRSDAPTLMRRAPFKNLEAGWSPERKRDVDPGCVIVAIVVSLFGKLGSSIDQQRACPLSPGSPRVQLARQACEKVKHRKLVLRAHELGFRA